MTQLTNPVGGADPQPEAASARALMRPPRDDGNALTRSSTGKKVLVYALLLLFALLYIYPFVVQLVTSVKTNADAVANPLSLTPDPFTWAAFNRLGDTQFSTWFRNSVTMSSP